MTQERMKQHLADYQQALLRLDAVLKEDLTKAEGILDGALQRFEFTFELAWKLLKLYLQFLGIEANSPRMALKESFQQGYVKQQEIWLAMLEDRNKTTHLYDESLAKKIYDHVKNDYFKELSALADLMQEEMGKL